MKFTIGDRVLLKQTGEEGLITDYLNKEMWEVEVNGIKFPVYADDIDHPYLTWFTQKNKQKKVPVVPEQLPVEKENLRSQRLPRGIYLSFMPVFKAEELEDIVDILKIHLLNETSGSIRYSYDVKLFNKSSFTHEGTLHPFGHVYLHSIDYATMNDQPRFHWKLADNADRNLANEEGVLRIKPAKLFDQVNDLLVKSEATFSYLLVEDLILKPEAKTTSPALPDVIRKPVERPAKLNSLADLPRSEVDLHIEQLMESYHGLSNPEIMDIQLKVFERYLYLAIVHQLPRMIIIHGMGTGVLKDAIHKILKTVPEVSRYSNEWLGSYGFGATEVTFIYE